MRDEIRKRIETVCQGGVPEGYKRSGPYIIPKDWSVERLRNLSECTSRPNRDGKERPVYSVNNRRGFVPQSEQFEEGSYQDLDKSAYKIVKRGEFAYNPARVNVGSIGRLRDVDEAVVSSLYVCVRTNDKLDGTFFDCWTKTQDFQKETVRNLEGSVREYLFFENFSNIRMPLPPVSEQQKIAGILAACDRVIDLKQKRVEELQSLKKTCLAKMFPREGSDVPELRFPGFTGPWEQRKLGDAFSFLQNNTLSRAELDEDCGAAKNVHYGDILTVFGDVLDISNAHLPYVPSASVTERLNGAFLQDGDIVMADTAEDESAGKCTEVMNTCGALVLAGLHTIPMRPARKYAAGYLAYYLNSPSYHDQLLPLMQGIKVTSVSKSAIQSTKISFPSGITEQAAIAHFFTQIDSLVTLHQRELEAAQQKKKALMQLLLTGLVRVQV